MSFARWLRDGIPLLVAITVACGGSSVSAPTSPSQSVSTPPPGLSTYPQASSCVVSYTAPGTYALDADVAPADINTSCIYVAASGVTLDCAEHAVSGYVLIVSGSSNVTVRNCTATGIAPVIDASGLLIDHNTLSAALFVSGAERSVIRANTIGVHSSPSAVLALSHGHDNQVVDNSIDGGGARGSDDGIILSDERNDTIRDNTIRNVFDAGVETINVLANSTISNNTISNAVTAGVGAYWCTAWQNVTVADNRFSATRAGIRIEYSNDSHCTNWGSAPQPAFSANVIADNTLDPSVATTPGIQVRLQEAEASVNGNVIRGNNFGVSTIDLQPLAGFVDGGGNVCGDGGTFHCR